jgi:hypothetical protein
LVSIEISGASKVCTGVGQNNAFSG